MKYFGRLVLCVTLLGFLAVVGQAQDPNRPAGLGKAGDLYAGNIKNLQDVGDIYVWKDSVNIYVEYFIPADSTPGDPWDNWYITGTHVEVKYQLGLIPQSKGNPVPGLFTYKATLDNVTGYTQVIPLNEYLHGEVFIAAHADVCKGGVNGLEFALPENQFNIEVIYYNSNKSSYFYPVTIWNDDWLNNDAAGNLFPLGYPGWCVDLDHLIVPGTPYFAKAYSSYDLENVGLLGLVDKPDNLDLVNWVLNHGYLGMTASDGNPFTWMDIQYAIWYLIDDGDPSINVNTKDLGANMTRVNEIRSQAWANGEGYIPACGQLVWVILETYTAELVRQQTLMIPVPFPCKSCETAWAAMEMTPGGAIGYPFSGKNWATYLKLTPILY